MDVPGLLRFITAEDCKVEELPWGKHEWLCQPGITDTEQLLLVRVTMPPGKAHQFHRHPTMEEIIFVVSGEAEQWVGREHRIMRAGEIAHIPMDVVHGTYNASDTPLVFLAILSPANSEGPALVDVCQDHPWCELKTPVVYGETSE